MKSNNRISLLGILLFGMIVVSNSGCGGGAATPPAVVATQLAVSVSAANATVGTALSVTVRAVDASGALVTTYAGTVHFTSSDTQATLPADSTLTGGTGNFSVIFKSPGNQTVSAKDTATASIAGTSAVVSVAAASLAINLICNYAAGGCTSTTAPRAERLAIFIIPT